jgi:hypothetical protein
MLTDDRDFSDPAVGAAPERRTGKRHQSVLLVGKVRRGTEETACLVHDVSQHGMMARFPVPPRVGEELLVEMRGLTGVRGTIRWVNGRKAGIKFVEPQPVEQVFQLKREDGLVARSPRFPFHTAVSLRFEGGRFRAEALDISVGGVKLVSDHVVAAGETGQVVLLDTGTALFGKVCWAHDGQFGFRFAAPLPLETLGQILGR